MKLKYKESLDMYGDVNLGCNIINGSSSGCRQATISAGGFRGGLADMDGEDAQ